MALYYYNKYTVRETKTYEEVQTSVNNLRLRMHQDGYKLYRFRTYKDYRFDSSTGVFSTYGASVYEPDTDTFSSHPYLSSTSGFYKVGMRNYTTDRDDSNGTMIGVFSAIKYTSRVTNVSYSRGSLVQSNVVAENGTYPTNGEHSDGYWYVRGSIVEPSIPSSIGVSPSIVNEGETISISWGTATRATSYNLERSINGGSFSQIYSGSLRSYSEVAQSSWNTVQYRVRGYNSGGYSGYRTSNIITVKHFPEFNMKINGALKVSSDGWVKVNGVLRPIKEISVKVDGSLKEL